MYVRCNCLALESHRKGAKARLGSAVTQICHMSFVIVEKNAKVAATFAFFSRGANRCAGASNSTARFHSNRLSCVRASIIDELSSIKRVNLDASV